MAHWFQGFKHRNVKLCLQHILYTFITAFMDITIAKNLTQLTSLSTGELTAPTKVAYPIAEYFHWQKEMSYCSICNNKFQNHYTKWKKKRAHCVIWFRWSLRTRKLICIYSANGTKELSVVMEKIFYILIVLAVAVKIKCALYLNYSSIKIK